MLVLASVSCLITYSSSACSFLLPLSQQSAILLVLSSWSLLLLTTTSLIVSVWISQRSTLMFGLSAVLWRLGFLWEKGRHLWQKVWSFRVRMLSFSIPACLQLWDPLFHASLSFFNGLPSTPDFSSKLFDLLNCLF